MRRFEVRVVKGSPKGDLYELEQTTCFQIIDIQANEILLTLEGKMEASLSRENGLWENYVYSGVSDVTISADEKTANVKYYDGEQENITLPKVIEQPNHIQKNTIESQIKLSEEPLPTIDDIKKLVSYLPHLHKVHDKPVKKWLNNGNQNDGSTSFPYPYYQPEVYAFFSLAMKEIWMDHSYKPDKAWKMLHDHQFVANASLNQIKTMLTFCVRGERFMDGHWGHMIEEGHIQRLLERLITILKNQENN